jgi:hypothetical protein
VKVASRHSRRQFSSRLSGTGICPTLASSTAASAGIGA